VEPAAAPAEARVEAEPAPKSESKAPGKPLRPHPGTGGGDVSAGNSKMIHASPSIRRYARELGVDLLQIIGSGSKGRITKPDVKAFIKSAMSGAPAGAAPAGGLSVSAMPEIDHAKFGEIERVALSRIKKISGVHLHRSWVTVPHVTQFDEADITDLEAFRKSLAKEAERKGVRLTPLIFLMKAVVTALQEYPNFNSSLDASGENLIMKKYFHIGIAVDTPKGLVVPVVRDVDRKGVFELAAELGEISLRARDGKLSPGDMQGGCFTISSLGGIGGTNFTPIVNAPEVAILGVSRSKMQPVYIDGEFQPRLILPLGLSYDHRVIDGAQAARFSSFLSQVISDIRRVLL
jgi:pyruvate dehydrogenase E2 component (dihydrolipoamide acetyltransferase)